MSDSPQTTASVLTPPGRGAVAIVAVEGERASELVERFFRPACRALCERSFANIVFGRWGGSSTKSAERAVAEDVIVHRGAANHIEVHCHGGRAAVQRILDDLSSVGVTQKSWQQWVAGRESSAIRRAARSALALATTERTARILLEQYHGALETELKRIINTLRTNASHAELVDSATDAIGRLLLRAAVGLHLVKPWRVAIVGPPNVGKSSLINALLGYQRSIVFDQPGTTRDLVRANAAFDGWPVELIDTAGICERGEMLEAAGIELARQEASSADCVLLVYDVSKPWNDEIAELSQPWPQAILVGNKCDLSAANHQISSRPRVLTSAINGQGTAELIGVIVAALIPLDLQPTDAVPFTDEHVADLESTRSEIHNGNAGKAIAILQSLLA